ncbi:hypothetical protein EGW08_013387 [Elysia chlorotica]|uniref:Uncharacterized protein n=1 Tax=Elysia chlorotica TaxID=188477 RepID=A0A3S0ZN64_ELYCH|nr:hypothetical protein EGW08_013387 [Elysia chlorotica]
MIFHYHLLFLNMTVGRFLKLLFCLSFLLEGFDCVQRTAAFKRVRTSEGAPDSIPQREELAVVVVVEEVVVSVVRTSIDQWLQGLRNSVVTVMDGNRPDVDKHKQAQVRQLV